MLTHEGIWAAIDALAERNGLSASGLARRAGLDPTTFNRSKRMAADGRARWPSTESIAKVIDATGSDFDLFTQMLARGDNRRRRTPMTTAPLLGFAEAGGGGYFDDAGYPVGEGWEEITLPADVEEAVYALEVSGESMAPLYRDGDVLIVSPTSSVRRGDRVVVRTREGEVMAKILQRRTSRTVELASLNPEFPVRQFRLENIEWIARILWASQ